MRGRRLHVSCEMAAIKDMTEEKAIEKLEKIMGTDKKPQPANDMMDMEDMMGMGEDMMDDMMGMEDEMIRYTLKDIQRLGNLSKQMVNKRLDATGTWVRANNRNPGDSYVERMSTWVNRYLWTPDILYDAYCTSTNSCCFNTSSRRNGINCGSAMA